MPGQTHWWKAERYELVDRWIKPATGALVAPYALPEQSRTRQREEISRETAFDEMLTLCMRDDGVDSNQVLSWCNRYGLLGTLHQQAVLIRCPAEPWQRPPDWPIPRSARPQFKQPTLVGRGPSWLRFASIKSNTEPPAGATVRSGWNDNNIEWNAFCAEYFPFGYPGLEEFSAMLGVKMEPASSSDRNEISRATATYSRAGWQAYCEPLESWKKTAERIAWAFDKKHIGVLNEMCSRTGVVAEEDDAGRITYALESPSLAAEMALQAIQRLSAGYRMVVCAASDCVRVITTTAYQREYCSDTCQARERKRRARRRTKEVATSQTASQKRGSA